ncbi:Tat pathway signal sequence domain protein [Streptomyces sp. NPDC002845]
MSGIGPVEPGEGTRAWDTAEPGEGTRAWDTAEPGAPLLPRPPHGPLGQFYARHHRAVIASVSAAVLLAGGGHLCTTRPEEPPPAPAMYPSQVVDIDYLGKKRPPEGSPSGSFSFAVEVTAQSGLTVIVVSISQPYAGISLTSAPRPPFRTRVGFPHKIVITTQVTDCAHAPRNAGLPFLNVTLRNMRAIQDHSFILGERYAHDLSEALRTSCGNDTTPSPKP